MRGEQALIKHLAQAREMDLERRLEVAQTPQIVALTKARPRNKRMPVLCLKCKKKNWLPKNVEQIYLAKCEGCREDLVKFYKVTINAMVL